MNDPMSIRNRLGALMAFEMALSGYDCYDCGDCGDHVIRTKKPLHPCLYCGKLHNHNNVCCSSEHYKAWKAGEKFKEAPQ